MGQLLLLNVLVLSAAGLAAAFWRTPWPLVAGSSIALLLWAVRLHRQCFVPISRAQTRQARVAEGLSTVIALWLLGSQ